MYSPTYKVKTTRKVKTRQKLNEYETFTKNQPEIPDFTCPHIDEVIDWTHTIIDKLKDIRNMNTKLRDNAEYWKVSAEEMQEKIHQHTELCEKIQKLISD